LLGGMLINERETAVFLKRHTLILRNNFNTAFLSGL
jgi:hypothetical protein